MPKAIPTIDEKDEALELLMEIEAAGVHCDQLAAKVESAKETLKDEKEAYESACEHLRALCRQRAEKNPLFDGATEQ